MSWLPAAARAILRAEESRLAFFQDANLERVFDHLAEQEGLALNAGQRQAVRTALTNKVAVLTGGRSFLLRDPRELEKTLADIARELRYQYLLGYVPMEPITPGASEWRSIRVVVKKPGLRVRARDGYMTD